MLTRSPVLVSGAPNGLGGPLGATGGVALSPLAAGNAGETWLSAGAAVVQPWGTDNTPSEAARPTPAVTAAPLMAGELTAAAPGPTPLLNAGPKIVNPLPTVLVDWIEFISELAEPSIARPEADIDADEPVPDTRLVADVSDASDDELVVLTDDTGDEDDVAEAVDASPCSALGIAAEVSGVDNTELTGVETADVSGDTVCAPVPADVPSA